MERAAFVCSHIFENSRPVRLVSRVDGDWQLLCGHGHVTKETPRLVGLNHLLERDPGLQELSDLPVDWEAEREAVGKPWIRTRAKPDA
jgi:hypothetical protein